MSYGCRISNEDVFYMTIFCTSCYHSRLNYFHITSFTVNVKSTRGIFFNNFLNKKTFNDTKSKEVVINQCKTCIYRSNYSIFRHYYIYGIKQTIT